MRIPAGFLLMLLAFVGAGCGAQARAGPESTLADLARGLEDPDRGVRYACVIALGKAGAPARLLAPALRDSSWCVRQEAGWWLRRAGPAALPVIEAALRVEDPTVRASAAWALSGFDAAAVAMLEKAIKDPVEAVRLEALMAARRMGTRIGRPHLVPLEPALKDRFTRGTKEERYEAALAIVWATPEAGWDVCELLAARLQADGRNSSRLDEIARALVQAGEAGSETIAAFGSKEWQHFRWSVESARYLFGAGRRDHKDAVPAPERGEAQDSSPARPLRAPDPESIASLLQVSTHRDVRRRIDAWFDLGEQYAHASAFASAVKSAERDERIAAASALATATGDAAALLGPLLQDPNWRVRCAAVRSWGRRGEDPARLAPFLADACLPLARAAYEAIRAARSAPAKALVATLESGHYGALHFAPALFERFGARAAPATERLAALLSHVDVNVRETAARCLAAVGPAAAAAVPHLIVALGDERLCVVAHASLALGRIGREDPVRATLADGRARVRAYGAFALGWMLGARRALDQVPYEARLPVLDLGTRPGTPAEIDFDALGDPLEPDDVALLRRALWSKSPDVAIPAAARLDYDTLDARESERVMELLLPEGQRRGGPADFGMLRSIIGSAELPACIQYVTRASRTSPLRPHIFANFHRIARAEHLPWLCFLERVQEVEAIDGNGEIWMPSNYTSYAMRARLATGPIGDPGPRPSDPVRALLRVGLQDPEGAFNLPQMWMLNDFQPDAADADLLLRFVRVLHTHPAAQEDPKVLWAALRALGRVHDDASAAFLRRLALERTTAGQTAAGALARRGNPLARALLAERGRSDQAALLVLADASPRDAARVISAWLSDESQRGTAVAFFADWEQNDFQIGARLPPNAVIGIEPALLAAAPDATTLARAALHVPGCATVRVASALFDKLENDAARPYLAEADREEDAVWTSAALEVVAFLHAADPERLKALLSYWVTREDDDTAWAGIALDGLYLLGDTRHVKQILARLEEEGDFDPDVIDRIDGPALRAWLTARSKNEDLESSERTYALAALAYLHGWPHRQFDLDDFPEGRRVQVADWVRQGRIDLVRAVHPEPENLLADERPPGSAVWAQLGRGALAGDAQARAAFWSALRAGRYRWIHYNFDGRMHSLGRDWSTYPHWIADLDSNCCRVSDGLACDLFEEALGMEDLYGTECYGFGRPISERVREWFDLKGGALTWSPILDRWIPTPE